LSFAAYVCVKYVRMCKNSQCNLMCKKCGAYLCATLATQELTFWIAEKNRLSTRIASLDYSKAILLGKNSSLAVHFRSWAENESKSVCESNCKYSYTSSSSSWPWSLSHCLAFSIFGDCARTMFQNRGVWLGSRKCASS